MFRGKLWQFGMVALGIGMAVPAVGSPLDPKSYAAIGNLDAPASATLVIDTGTSPPTISGAGKFDGILQSQAGGPDIAVFTFSKVNIAAGAVVSIKGGRPLALLSQSDIDIAALIDLSGGAGGSGSGASGTGVAGGGTGGGGGKVAGEVGRLGSGPGGGAGGTSCAIQNDPAGLGEGAGFGGDGLSVLRGSGGRAYGALLARLQGGSGGGGAAAFTNPDTSIVSGGGGGGGGALELGAVGTIRLTERVLADGGRGGFSGGCAGGSGSGGALLIHGQLVTYATTLSASGVGSFWDQGGGGRIALLGLPSVLLDNSPPPNVSVGGYYRGSVIMGGKVSNVMRGSVALNVPTVLSGVSPRIEALIQGDLVISYDSSAFLERDNVLPATARLTIDPPDGSYVGSRFELGAFKQTVASIAGRGTIDLGSGELTVGEGGADSQWIGRLTGTGALRKIGAGTLGLSSNSEKSPYTGPITVTDGTLAVYGEYKDSAVQLTGGTLRGSGLIGMLSASGGTIIPERTNEAGLALRTAGLALSAGTTLDFRVGKYGFDPLRVTGSVSVSGALKVQLDPMLAQKGEPIMLISNDGSDAVVGEFSQVEVQNAPFPTAIDYAGGDGNDVILRFIVPEPTDMGTAANPPPSQSSGCSVPSPGASGLSTSWLGGLGGLLALLGVSGRRRRRAAAP